MPAIFSLFSTYYFQVISSFIIIFTVVGSEDYEGRTSYVKFSSGSVAGDEQCIDIVIIDDNCKEDNESFVFAICAGGDPAVHIDDFYSNVYIIDQDSKNFVHLILACF